MRSLLLCYPTGRFQWSKGNRALGSRDARPGRVYGARIDVCFADLRPPTPTADLVIAGQLRRVDCWRLKQKSRRGIRAPADLPFNSLPLSHPEGIERRLIDRRCRCEPVVGLVGGERLAG
jgi:hypothetical protein